MKRLATLLISVLVAASFGASLRASDILGLVLNVQGEASLIRGGKARPLMIADSLMAGDQVTVAAGSVAFVYCPKSERITLAKGTAVGIEKADIKVEKGSAPDRKPTRRCAVPRIALGEESIERVGGLVARGLAPIPLYLGQAVSTARPTFAWARVGDDPVYRLVLRDDLGQAIWEAETTENSLTYPDSNEPLAEGRYIWELSAEAEGESIAYQSTHIHIKPDDRFLEAPPDSPGEQLLLAIELENAGYFSEAAALIRSLREQNPDDIRWTRRLVMLYWNSGLVVATRIERQRLDNWEDQGGM